MVTSCAQVELPLHHAKQPWTRTTLFDKSSHLRSTFRLAWLDSLSVQCRRHQQLCFKYRQQKEAIFRHVLKLHYETPEASSTPIVPLTRRPVVMD